jgi:hypothetical protein
MSDSPVLWDMMAPVIPEGSGFIYVISCQETSLHKIGLTDNVARRFDELQRASAFPLRIATVYQCASADMRQFEKKLHSGFAAKRAYGEWFKLSPDDLDLLSSGYPKQFMETKPLVLGDDVEDALREATDAQIKSEWARRTQAMRKTRGGGRRSGLSTDMPRYIRKPADIAKVIPATPKTLGHHPRCKCWVCVPERW